jgi:hypothetical protein
LVVFSEQCVNIINAKYNSFSSIIELVELIGSDEEEAKVGDHVTTISLVFLDPGVDKNLSYDYQSADYHLVEYQRDDKLCSPNVSLADIEIIHSLRSFQPPE